VSSLTGPPATLPASAPVANETPSTPAALSLRMLGGGSLLGLIACSLVTVVIAAERPSLLAPVSRPGFFPVWMAGPLRGLWPSLTGDGETLAWLVSGLLVAMFALYVVAVRLAPELPVRWTIATLLAVHVVFLLAPPLSYTDVFNYIDYGRMGVVHHLNPYVTLPVAEPHSDPAYGLSNWHHLLSPYGPLFTLLSYALVPLGVVLAFWALKLIVGLASLAMLALVWRCARLLGRSPAAAVAFVGLNPIVLVWGLGADHNDSLMMLLVMLAAYSGLRSQRASGAPGFGSTSGIALVGAAFIKAPAAALLPVLLLATRLRRRFLVGSLIALAVLGAASVIVFGVRLPGLVTQSRLVTAIGIPNLVGLALGLGGETPALHALFTAFALLSVVGCAIWVWRAPSDWIRACGVALLVLVISLSWAAPWYVLWILPFAALCSGRQLRVTVTLLGAYFILAFMPAAVTLTDAIGFRPAGTALGRLHTRQINALVR
jgi:hypothetical protein